MPVTAKRAPHDAGLLVPGRYYRRLLEQLPISSVARARLLQDAGIAAQPAAGELLTLGQAGALADAALRLSADPHLGFQLGASFRPSDHEVLGYALLSAANLHQALILAARYWRLLTPVYAMRCEISAAKLVIAWKPLAMLPSALQRLHGEAIVAGVHNELRLLLGDDPGGELWLPSDWLATGHPYTSLRPTRCHRLDRADDTLRWVLPEAIGKRPLALADAHGLARARSRCEALLTKLTADGSIASWARLMIRQADDHQPTQSELAELLNLSARSLHRRLAAEGVSYQQLALGERMGSAARLLRESSLSLNEISLSLGYSDVANFTRAFSRHMGVSPGRYRRQRSVSSPDNS